MPNLNELLLRRGALATESLARAQLVHAETGERIDSILTRLGLISEQALARLIAEESGLPIAAGADYPEAAICAGQVSPRFLRDAKAIPLGETEDGVTVALVNPLDSFVLRALGFAIGREIRPMVAHQSDLELALDRLYGTATTPAEDIDPEADEADLERMKDLTSDAPVIRAVNRLIARAAEERASDIHIEPTEDALQVRLRIDGVMRDEPPLPATMRASFVSRIKVMSGLNIAERRLPQDGRLRVAVRGHEIDLRVATAPTIHGESVVMRLLDRSHLALDFATLGFDPDLQAQFEDIIHRPHGIVLVTGATGSGKTTTLYAALSVLNRPERKILTIEDPIEYRLAGVNQTQANPQIGLDFAAALRSFLRQDPDVIMVGEIRDLETAQIAVQAALTGHTILSTLHTNTAAAAVTRLLDMGVEPFLITSTVNALLAQKLVRRLCPACRRDFVPDASLRAEFNLPDNGEQRFYEPVGCAQCGQSGYRGRIALLELLPVTEEIGRLILHRAESREIERAAIQAGMRSLVQDGLAKARAGQTSLQEIFRVTREG